MFISAFSTVLSLANDSFLVHYHYSHPAIPFWNVMMRCGVFIIVVFLLSRLKIALIHEKEASRVKSNISREPSEPSHDLDAGSARWEQYLRNNRTPFPRMRYHDQIIELGNREFGASGVLQFG